MLMLTMSSLNIASPHAHKLLMFMLASQVRTGLKAPNKKNHTKTRLSTKAYKILGSDQSFH